LGRLSVITPILGTPLRYLRECVASMSRAFACSPPGLFDRWTIVIDGDHRPIEHTVRAAMPADLDGQLLLRFVRLPKTLGLSAARNAGVRAATGDFVTWLDADDTVEVPAFIEFATMALDVLASDPITLMVISDNADCDSELRTDFVRQKAAFVEAHQRYRHTARDPIYAVDFVYQAQIIRRADFLLVGGFREGYIGEDVEFLLRLCATFPVRVIDHVPIVAYRYRKNVNGIVHTQRSILRRQNVTDYERIARTHLVNAPSLEFAEFTPARMVNGVCLRRRGNDDREFFNVFLPPQTEAYYVGEM